MGCSSVKENVVVEVVYCGGVGWSVPAKKVCEGIKAKLPKCLIDCRPEDVFTGVLEVNLLLDRNDRRPVFKGDKETVLASVDRISTQVEQAYNAL